MAINFNGLKRLINQYKLTPASKRALSLFTLSSVAIGYTKMLRENIGISYLALGGLGRGDSWTSMIDENVVISQTKKFVEINLKNLDRVAFGMADKIFSKCKNEILKNKKYAVSRPEKLLASLTVEYPTFIRAIGIYNCFWRFVGNNENVLPKKYIAKNIRNRERMARFYSEVIEGLLEKAAKSMGKRKKFDGDLLTFLSVREMVNFLKNGRLSPGQLAELKKRREGYFYLFIERGDREIIVSNPAVVKKINDEFFRVKEAPKLIKGYAACGGMARGRVLILENNLGREIKKKDYILVASATNPKLAGIVRKSAAIVADEGGLLSHAAIISRELGIPCVIGTKIATQVFKDGDMVEVDAEKGIVRKL